MHGPIDLFPRAVLPHWIREATHGHRGGPAGPEQPPSRQSSASLLVGHIPAHPDRAEHAIEAVETSMQDAIVHAPDSTSTIFRSFAL